ncbi:MAG: DMT family transporter [Hydrogenovibrio sp.]|uniref:DMT family transporter n=1 Tax=Hydrogenovibrio sp. TaxID=2065821 RepID=UPI00286FC1D1|nr:DMT family transporter [Hydrogenovibrio sp.]MDR9498611.1 DMT family transporter [Hydrogenovibrio sp.]
MTLTPIHRHPGLPVFVLIFASVFWGMSWLPLKSLNQMGFDGPFLIMGAYSLLALAFLPFLFRHRRDLNKNFKAWLLILALGGGANLAFNYALIYGEVIRVMVLFYLLPLWGVLGGKFLLQEHIDMKGWLAAGLAVSGAFFIVGGHRIFDHPPTLIDLIALLSGFLFAMNNIAFRAHQALTVTTKLSALFLGTTLFSGILFVVQGDPVPQVDSYQAWWFLAFYGLVWLLIANYGSQWAVTHMPANRAAILMITELLAAVISAILIANEILTPLESMGGLLIVTAAILEALRSHRPETPPLAEAVPIVEEKSSRF